MSDVYISLAWILKKPLERSRQFIFYGVGRAKLENEHRKSQLSDLEMDTQTDEIIKATEAWINFQRYDFLTTVNVGSWSEKSVRKMAEEADCLPFYNFVYQPFSSAAHSTWNHIGRHNMEMSDNPLHDFLLVPTIPKVEPESFYIEIFAKYIEKCFHAFHETFDTERLETNAYSKLQKDLDDFAEQQRKGNG